jgi:uncharacterized OsmC-like protein
MIHIINNIAYQKSLPINDIVVESSTKNEKVVLEHLKSKYNITAKFNKGTNFIKVLDKSYMCPIHNRIHTSVNLSYI